MAATPVVFQSDAGDLFVATRPWPASWSNNCASLLEEQAALAGVWAATPPDWESIGQRVHRLQSGSAYLGVEQIAVTAHCLEAEDPRAGGPDRPGRGVAEVGRRA